MIEKCVVKTLHKTNTSLPLKNGLNNPLPLGLIWRRGWIFLGGGLNAQPKLLQITCAFLSLQFSSNPQHLRGEGAATSIMNP